MRGDNMNPAWLILIIPAALAAGAFCMALVTAGIGNQKGESYG